MRPAQGVCAASGLGTRFRSEGRGYIGSHMWVILGLYRGSIRVMWEVVVFWFKLKHLFSDVAS